MSKTTRRRRPRRNPSPAPGPVSRRPSARTPVPRPASRTIPVLDGIRVWWEWLCLAPHPLTLDPAVLAGLPGLSGRAVALDEVRARLLDHACPRPVRDAVWAHLISRARAERPRPEQPRAGQPHAEVSRAEVPRVEQATWTVACAGMALPMLAAACRSLSRGRGVDPDDVASGIVTGFLTALARVDLDRSGVLTTLRWAAFHGGHTVLREQHRAPRPLPDDHLARLRTGKHTGTAQTPPGTDPGEAGTTVEINTPVEISTDDERGPGLSPPGRWESAPPPTQSGHPDLVLAAAVTDGVLSITEAALIGDTRLEPISLAQAAARRGHTVSALTMQRLRAELRLLAHLRPGRDTDKPTGGDDSAPDEGHDHDQGTDARRRSVTARRDRVTSPRVPGCGRAKPPSVSNTGTTTHRPDPSTRDAEHGDERGGDGSVTR